MKKEQQTTTRVQLVKMLRNMTDYSNMYNTIPNCLQEKKKKEAAGAVYLMDPKILNNHQLGKTGQKVNLPRENSSQDNHSSSLLGF